VNGNGNYSTTGAGSNIAVNGAGNATYAGNNSNMALQNASNTGSEGANSNMQVWGVVEGSGWNTYFATTDVISMAAGPNDYYVDEPNGIAFNTPYGFSVSNGRLSA